MGKTVLRGQLLTPDGWLSGTLHGEGGLIAGTGAGEAPGGRLILPGFIDAHVHGGGGADTLDGEAGVRRLARFHAGHGTTTLLPTTLTRPWPEVLAALQGVRAVMDAPGEGEAAVPGAHLEGPFLHPRRLGAQPPFALRPTPERVREVLNTGVLRVVTLAPDVEGALEAARQFLAAGVRVSLGHTDAGYGAARRFQTALLPLCRATGVPLGATHLFNAMPGLSAREPGTVGAVLDTGGLDGGDQQYAELIFDTHHVHPAALRLARAALGERLLMVSDAMRAAGMQDGESELGGQPVTVRDGVARLPGGALAGSLLTLDAALRNLVAAGLSVQEASAHLSAVPARYLGLSDRGELRPGLRLDAVVLDGALQVREVWVAGRRVNGPV